MKSIADIRRDYQMASLIEAELSPNPFDQFKHWWADATHSLIDEVNAMTLSTVTESGLPDARIVLLKGFDETGFVFYTNYNSMKGRRLQQNPNASLLFFWKELERQVRISGTVQKVSEGESDEYFNSRPEGSKLGAWTSAQSDVIASRESLEAKYRQLMEDYRNKPILRPPHWGGYRVYPSHFEFWQGRSSRMHDRICYQKTAETWKISRLSP